MNLNLSVLPIWVSALNWQNPLQSDRIWIRVKNILYDDNTLNFFRLPPWHRRSGDSEKAYTYELWNLCKSKFSHILSDPIRTFLQPHPSRRRLPACPVVPSLCSLQKRQGYPKGLRKWVLAHQQVDILLFCFSGFSTCCIFSHKSKSRKDKKVTFKYNVGLLNASFE